MHLESLCLSDSGPVESAYICSVVVPDLGLQLTERGDRTTTGYTTDIITDRTLDWLKKERNPDQPFFLCSWHKAPHRNWLPAPKYMKKYDTKNILKEITVDNIGLYYEDY